MATVDVKALDQRLELLREENLKQHGTWEKIAKYAAPSLELMFATDDTEDKEYATDVFDTTAIEAAKTMTDGIVGNLVSKSNPWVAMHAMDPEVDRKKTVQEFFQDVNQRMYAALARSNFYNILPSYTHMGITIATTTMYVNEDVGRGNIVFSMRHPKEVFIDQDWYGEIDTIYREVQIGARAAASFFSDSKNALSKKLLEAAESDPYSKFKFNHAVFPATDEYFKYPGVTGTHASVYWEPGEKEHISVGGYNSFPFVTWRYRVEGNEKYGRGPTHDALPDILGLNSMAKSLLQAAQKAANPPINIPEELKNRVRNKPGGANYYRDPGRVVTPWNVATNYPIGVDQWDRKKKAVQEHYYYDLWKMLTNLTQRMTTVEISERRGEKATLIGTPVTKYESEGHDRMLYRVFEIEESAGRMPEIPSELSGQDVVWQYNGPLAQIQKRTAQNEGIKSTLLDLERLMAYAPESAMVINWQNTARDLAMNNGFPAGNLYTEAEVEKIKAEAQQAAAEAQQADNMQKVGSAMGGINQPIEPDSAMAGMIQ